MQHSMQLLDIEIQRINVEIEKQKPSELEPLLAIVISIVLMFAPAIYKGGLHSQTVYITNNTTIYIPSSALPSLIGLQITGNDTTITISNNTSQCATNISLRDHRFYRSSESDLFQIQIKYPSQIQYFYFSGSGFYLLFLLVVFEFVALGIGSILIGYSKFSNKKSPLGIANTIYFFSILVTLVSITYIIFYITFSTESIMKNFSWWSEIEKITIIIALSPVIVGIMGVVVSSVLKELEKDVKRETNTPKKVALGALFLVIGMFVLIVSAYKIIWLIPSEPYKKVVYTITTIIFSVLVVIIVLKYYNKTQVVSSLKSIQGELIQMKQHVLTEVSPVSVARWPTFHDETSTFHLVTIEIKIEDNPLDKEILENSVIWIHSSSPSTPAEGKRA